MSDLDDIKARAAQRRKNYDLATMRSGPGHFDQEECYQSEIDIDRVVAIAEEVSRYNLIIHTLAEPEAFERVNRLQLAYDQARADAKRLREEIARRGRTNLDQTAWANRVLADTDRPEYR